MPALSSTSPALNTPVPCGPVGWQNAIRNRSVPVRPSCGRVRASGCARLAAEARDIVAQRLVGSVAEGDHALLAALAVADVDAPGLPGHVGQGEPVQLRVAQAGIEEDQDDGPVAAAELRGGVADVQQRVPSDTPLSAMTLRKA